MASVAAMCPVSLFCWFGRHIIKLFVCLLNFLTYVLPCLSTCLRIGPFYFQAGGRRRRPNLALVSCVLMLLYILLWMYVCFRCVWFSFSVDSQEIGWEERLRIDLLCVG